MIPLRDIADHEDIRRRLTALASRAADHVVASQPDALSMAAHGMARYHAELEGVVEGALVEALAGLEVERFSERVADVMLDEGAELELELDRGQGLL